MTEEPIHRRTVHLIDRTNPPNMPKFREPQLGESQEAYELARAEATDKYVQQAITARGREVCAKLATPESAEKHDRLMAEGQKVLDRRSKALRLEPSGTPPSGQPAPEGIPLPTVDTPPNYFVLYVKTEDALIDYWGMTSALAMVAEEPCGLVFAEGIDGDSWRWKLADMDLPVLFKDQESARNAIRHLKKGGGPEEAAYEILEWLD